MFWGVHFSAQIAHYRRSAGLTLGCIRTVSNRNRLVVSSVGARSYDLPWRKRIHSPPEKIPKVPPHVKCVDVDRRGYVQWVTTYAGKGLGAF